MAYKLNVTEHAGELLDNLVYHLIYRLKNEQAAQHLLNSIDSIYDNSHSIRSIAYYHNTDLHF